MMCNKINIIDDDYKMCYNCYFYYDKHNPKVIDDFENNSFKLTEKIINCDSSNIKLLEEQYICLSCGCSNGYKFDDYKKIEYYKNMIYNRKYHLEKYIKKYEKYENFDRIKVIELFYKIINRLLDFNLKRKRIFKFELILKKIFTILDYKIKINTKESNSFNKI